MEQRMAAADGRPQLDPGDDSAAYLTAVGEFRDATAAREQFSALRTQGRETTAVAAEHQAQTVFPEPLRHVATVDQEEPEQARLPVTPDGESTRVESTHDPPRDAQVDHDSDPETNSDSLPTERPRRQEHERGVVARLGPPRRRGPHVQDRLPAGRDAEPPRPEAEPGRGPAGGANPGPAVERASESRPRDVDDQRPPSGVPHRDRGDRRASEGHTQRARAEPNAAAGRGTRNGCRDQTDGRRGDGAPHRPITV